SAKIIPGNENSIGRIINHLFRRGANVIYEKVSEIHVSGHASKEELKLMLNLVKPKYFMPIHGEHRHKVYHSRLAEKTGVEKANIFILDNGDVLEVTDDSARLNGKVTSGRIFVDGKGVGDVEDMVLRDRRKLAHDGIVIVIMAIEKLTGNIVSGPDIISRGFIFEDVSQEIINYVKELVYTTVKDLDSEMIADKSLVQAKIRSVLKKYLRNSMDRKPMIMPIIYEV
ncbi:MAG: ribonuclease J, partial [Nitrospirota bacterium]|nr:ribonuclease J [Nitrospirota bacterium]